MLWFYPLMHLVFTITLISGYVSTFKYTHIRSRLNRITGGKLRHLSSLWKKKVRHCTKKWWKPFPITLQLGLWWIYNYYDSLEILFTRIGNTTSEKKSMGHVRFRIVRTYEDLRRTPNVYVKLYENVSTVNRPGTFR